MLGVRHASKVRHSICQCQARPGSSVQQAEDVVMLQQALLQRGDVEKILTAALRVLESEGMMFQSEVFLQALEKRGAQVDWPRERARLPRQLVLTCRAQG